MTENSNPHTLFYWRYARYILLIMAMLLMMGHFFVYVYYSVELMQFPFDYDQGEGFELVDVMYMSKGHWPYQNSDIWPYYSSNYPPIYHVILVPFAWLFGSGYWYGRLVAFLGTLITAAAIGFAIYRDGWRGKSQISEIPHDTICWRIVIPVLLGLSYLASNYIYHVGPLFRQHYFMVMLETLAVVILVNLFDITDPKQRRRVLWTGIILLILAGYTKQLSYATSIAVFGWLFLRNPRLSIVNGLLAGIIVGAIFLGMNVATHGEWWNNAIGANVNEFIGTQFTGLLKQYLRLHWPLVVMAGLVTVYELYFARLSLYTVWFIFASANTVTAGTWGAGDSYFATSLAASCILAGIFMLRTLKGSWEFPENYLLRFSYPVLKKLQPYTPRIYRTLSVLSLALMVIYGLSVVKIPTSPGFWKSVSEFLGVEPRPGHRYPLYDAAGWTPGYAVIGHLPSQQDVENGWKIVDIIKNSDKPVMSEEAGFSIRADREVISNPTQLRNLYNNGLLDKSHLVDDIVNQRFGAMIFRAQFYPEPVLAAVYDAYYQADAIPMNGFNYEIWRPDPTWDTRRDILNFLEDPGDSKSLEMEIPAKATDIEASVEDWVLAMMMRRAWYPDIEPGAVVSENECTVHSFIRADEQATLTICPDTLVIQAPESVE